MKKDDRLSVDSRVRSNVLVGWLESTLVGDVSSLSSRRWIKLEVVCSDAAGGACGGALAAVASYGSLRAVGGLLKPGWRALVG